MGGLKCLVGILLPLVLSVSCMSDGRVDDDGRIVEGSRVPIFSTELSVNDPADWRFDCVDRFDSYGSDGIRRVIFFFNTQCPDCRKELPAAQELYDSIKEDETLMMACISREQGEDEILDYWKQAGLTLPYSAQQDRSIYDLFASSGIPRIYLIDARGTVRRVYNDRYLPSAAELMGIIGNM